MSEVIRVCQAVRNNINKNAILTKAMTSTI